MKIDEFNALDVEAMCQELKRCCHCTDWALRVARRAPFSSVKKLQLVCVDHWTEATETEILEAFRGHPQIGDREALRGKYAASAIQEQGQIATAGETTLSMLAQLNDDYLRKFGFIFIVCATHKSAAEMLGLLEARIDNTRAIELINGAREQGLIMQLRLEMRFED